MNKWLKRLGVAGATLGLLAAGAVGLVTAVDRPLAVPAGLPPIPAALPAAQPPGGLDFSVIVTSHSEGAPEALIVGGGSWFTRRQPVQAAVLIRHPQGNLLYDTGLGRQVDRQFAVNSPFHKALFAYRAVQPAVDQLRRHGLQDLQLKMIVPSHLHWDHVSGLEDFPDTEVWATPAERHAAEAGELPAFIASQFAQVRRWRDLVYDGGPCLGFAASHDVFGDGSVVLVPLAGHTAGQIGLLLSLPSGRRYLFTGDVSWTLKGLQRPADRSWLARRLVKLDHDEATNHAALVHLHRLLRAHPRLAIVPAHDERVMAGLPRFPDFQN